MTRRVLVAFEVSQYAPAERVEQRVDDVIYAWARRDLPLGWLERGVEAVPGVLSATVIERVPVSEDDPADMSVDSSIGRFVHHLR